MLTPIAYGLAIALDLLILLIGGRFLIAPPARRQPAMASPPNPAATPPT
jgi:hypothetical protein